MPKKSTICNEKISIYPAQENRWKKISVYSHIFYRRIEKNSAYPAYGGDKSNASQYPPHAKSAQKAVRTG
jgi:hypothetical protein